MMRRRYFSALMFTAVLVFASPAGKTMASQVSENQTQSISEDMNAAVYSETEGQIHGADDAITPPEPAGYRQSKRSLLPYSFRCLSGEAVLPPYPELSRHTAP